MMIKPSTDVMLDLETCGTSAGCVILSIGACTFDLQHEFYERISVLDSDSFGFTEDPGTMAWWDKQNPDMRDEAFSGTVGVVEALDRFSSWFRSLPAKEVFIWGNGADFDQPILKAYYEGMRTKLPWKPFNGRCYRTLKNLYPFIKGPSANASHHHALEDAKWQAVHAREILGRHFHGQQRYQD